MYVIEPSFIDVIKDVVEKSFIYEIGAGVEPRLVNLIFYYLVLFMETSVESG